jgi:malonyl-CoA/methylmalonyl-CoA synthetase
MSIDLAERVALAAREYPGRTFITTPTGAACRYGSLEERSGRLITVLEQRGVVAGDRVAVQVEKSVEAVLLYVACLRMGAIFVPINVANTAPEVAYFLEDSQPRLAVVAPPQRPVLEAAAHRAGVGHIETLGADGEGSLMELAGQAQPSDGPFEFGGATAIAAIVYTSGTTGRSKGAMLTRANLATNAGALAAAWRFTGEDVLLHALPLFHIHGLFAAINTAIASASTVLLLPRFDAAEVISLLPRSTVFMGVPTHYTRLLQHAALDGAAAAMRLFVSGSAPLLVETHREFRERTGHAILERYGMTETLINTSNPYAGARVPGSVGPALPGVGIRVVADGGAIASTPEAIGTLEVRGPNVFAGYWRDAEKTRAEFTADGWFKTGDVGRIDGDGYVHILGRAKDLVISGGYNVYPREVEAVLDELPGVLESAVFGVPHPDFGEGVTAAVVLKPGTTASEDALLRALQERLARYKIPKRVVFLHDLPRNTMGKVQKNLLRAAHAALYVAAG